MAIIHKQPLYGYYKDRDYSHWLLNKGNNAVSFIINGNSPFAVDTQIILLPSLASDGNMSFDGWYTNNGLTTPPEEFEVTSDTKLYGRYCGPNFTVTPDVNGGDELAVKEMAIGCDRVYGDIPEATRTGYSFLGWFTEKNESITGESIVEIPDNHTLYAHWSINKYTLVFIFDNGSEPEEVRENPWLQHTSIECPRNATKRWTHTPSNKWDTTNMPNAHTALPVDHLGARHLNRKRLGFRAVREVCEALGRVLRLDCPR